MVSRIRNIDGNEHDANRRVVWQEAGHLEYVENIIITPSTTFFTTATTTTTKTKKMYLKKTQTQVFFWFAFRSAQDRRF